MSTRSVSNSHSDLEVQHKHSLGSVSEKKVKGRKERISVLSEFIINVRMFLCVPTARHLHHKEIQFDHLVR